MPCEKSTNTFALEFLNDAALSRVLCDQAHRPTSATIRRRAAYQRDDRALLGVIEHARWVRARCVRHSGFHAAVQETPTYTPDLAGIGANRITGLLQVPPRIQQLEDSNAPPVAFAQRALPLDLLKLR
jgi:hypothetical protein